MRIRAMLWLAITVSANAQYQITSWTTTTSLPAATAGLGVASYGAHVIAIFNDTQHVSVGDVGSDGQVTAWRATLAAPTAGLVARPVRVGDSLVVPAPGNSYIAKLANDGSILSWSSTFGTSNPATYDRAVAANGTTIYSIAGAAPGGVLQDAVEMATLAADGTLSPWQSITPLPLQLNDPQAEIIDGYLYVFGGEGWYGDMTPSQQVWRSPILAGGTVGAWEVAGSLLMPRPHAAHVVYNGTLHTIAGGVNSYMTNTVESVASLSLGSPAATVYSAALPTILNEDAAVVVNNYCYVLGGHPSAFGATSQDTVYMARLGPPIDSAGPITSNILATPDPAPVNTPLALSATIDDSATGASDIAGGEYTISGQSPISMAGPFNTADKITASATIAAIGSPGVYNVCVHGVDVAGNTGPDTCLPLPVYDPDAGFVTGSGNVWSPAGGTIGTASMSGSAHFAFVVKYLPGTSTPSGNLQFQFSVSGTQFTSTGMDWLVITSPAHATFQGTGVLGSGVTCKYQVDAWDNSFATTNGSVDAFGITIFACSTDNGTLYTLAPGPIVQGSIVMHN